MRYHIEMGGSDSHGAEARGAMDILVLPDWFGYWGIFLASALGMVASHMMLYHVRVQLCWKTLSGTADDVRYRLSDRSGPVVRWAVGALLLVALGMTAYAVQAQAFAFTYAS